MTGKSIVIIGVLVALAGLFMMYGPKTQYLGKLPGDIYYKKDNFVFYFPLATSIIISILLSIVFYFISRR